MKLRIVATIVAALAPAASAGGLLLPGAGAISTSRAGASVAASEDGEALALNPANLAKTHGTVIQLGAATIDYYMSFQRNGTYDALPNDTATYPGQRYPTMTNDAHPPLGFGNYQPVPVIAVVSDLGGVVPGLVVAAGLYAPNAYPFRDLNTVNGHPYFVPSDKGYQFPTFGAPPPPTRYDVIHQEAAIILPSIGVAYRVLPNLDVGGRFSFGNAQLKSTVALWGVPGNYNEWDKQDGLISIDAKDSFVPEWSLGATFRATPNLEIAGRYTSEIDINAKGTAYSFNGPEVSFGGVPVIVVPPPDSQALCAPGGTAQALKACLDLALPMTATVGGRYKFLDRDGKQRGDLELDLDWENWGLDRASNYLVTVDAQAATAAAPQGGIPLKQNVVAHGLQDTYGARLGGEYKIPVGEDDAVLVRGGVGYDTAAAKKGWERADLDGAARTMLAVGASYKLPRIQIDAGFGVILEGTRTDPRTCNPTGAADSMGCSGTPGYPTVGAAGSKLPAGQQEGPNPINPIVGPAQQAESPVNEGTYKSHYLLFMLGATYHF
jgi:long-subunit fatty acid transport protein